MWPKGTKFWFFDENLKTSIVSIFLHPNLKFQNKCCSNPFWRTNVLETTHLGQRFVRELRNLITFEFLIRYPVRVNIPIPPWRQKHFRYEENPDDFVSTKMFVIKLLIYQIVQDFGVQLKTFNLIFCSTCIGHRFGQAPSDALPGAFLSGRESSLGQFRESKLLKTVSRCYCRYFV